jgi:hypothetical protein
VNAKIINQLANTRIDTTQGTDMTKRLIATELTNAIGLTSADLTIETLMSILSIVLVGTITGRKAKPKIVMK